MNSSATNSSYLQSTTDTVDFNTTNFTDSSDYDYDESDESELKPVIWSIRTTIMVLSILIVLVLYKNLSEKRKNKVYDSLNLKHIMFSIFHVFLIELAVYTKDENMDYNSMSTELLCILEISAPMWTMCVSLKMFTDLCLFVGRGEVYSAKDFTVFGFSCIVTLHIYELLFFTLGGFLSEDANFTLAIRLTSVLLIISIPIVVACIIIKSLCFRSTDIVTTVGLFFLFHLIVFIFCDVCVVYFLIAKFTSKNDSVVDTATSVLHYRLIIEITWFIGSHYLGKALRIYSEN